MGKQNTVDKSGLYPYQGFILQIHLHVDHIHRNNIFRGLKVSTYRILATLMFKVSTSYLAPKFKGMNCTTPSGSCSSLTVVLNLLHRHLSATP